MQGNRKVSIGRESNENIESDFDENEMYQIDNMSIDDTKEKLEWFKREFESKL